jgi:hypothetical protein
MKKPTVMARKYTQKQFCSNKDLTHERAAKVMKQLKKNPELCEVCKTKPCVLAKYLYGDYDV